MSIFTRIINNVLYAKYRKGMKKALKEAKKHLRDEDDTAFRYWTKVYLYYSKKCLEMPLH